jgi:hypothetical protein
MQVSHCMTVEHRAHASAWQLRLRQGQPLRTCSHLEQILADHDAAFAQLEAALLAQLDKAALAACGTHAGASAVLRAAALAACVMAALADSAAFCGLHSLSGALMPSYTAVHSPSSSSCSPLLTMRP